MNNLLDLFYFAGDRVDYVDRPQSGQGANEPVQEIQHRSGVEKVWGEEKSLCQR
jgi:hypothetical protein